MKQITNKLICYIFCHNISQQFTGRIGYIGRNLFIMEKEMNGVLNYFIASFQLDASKIGENKLDVSDNPIPIDKEKIKDFDNIDFFKTSNHRFVGDIVPISSWDYDYLFNINNCICQYICCKLNIDKSHLFGWESIIATEIIDSQHLYYKKNKVFYHIEIDITNIILDMIYDNDIYNNQYVAKSKESRDYDDLVKYYPNYLENLEYIRNNGE